jgi:hypothetical protein
VRSAQTDWHLLAKHAQQHANAAGIIQTVEYSKLIGEWTRCEPHGRADFQIRA